MPADHHVYADSCILLHVCHFLLVLVYLQNTMPNCRKGWFHFTLVSAMLLRTVLLVRFRKCEPAETAFLRLGCMVLQFRQDELERKHQNRHALKPSQGN